MFYKIKKFFTELELISSSMKALEASINSHWLYDEIDK